MLSRRSLIKGIAALTVVPRHVLPARLVSSAVLMPPAFDPVWAQDIIVERDEFDANRVNVFMRPDFANQLRIVAALVEENLHLESYDVVTPKEITARLTGAIRANYVVPLIPTQLEKIRRTVISTLRDIEAEFEASYGT